MATGLPVTITDRSIEHRVLKIGEKDQIGVSILPSDTPPTGTPNTQKLLSGFIGDAGLDTGSLSMNVDGSVTPVNYFVRGKLTEDVHVKKITLIITGNAQSYNKFGNLSALTNGFRLDIVESGVTTPILNAKTGAEIINQFSQIFTQRISAGTADIELYQLDLTELVLGGFRLGKGGLDEVCVTVQDDLTGLTDLQVRVIGHTQE